MARRQRVLLVHWHREEADTLAIVLRDTGYETQLHFDAKANPKSLLPIDVDAVVISLRRLPSQGRELGAWLRRRKETRHLPLIYIIGDQEKTQRVQALLPDATFVSLDALAEGIAQAVDNPPVTPVVPGAMDAYAGVSLPKKLGVKDDSSVLTLGLPASLHLPQEIASRVTDGPASVVLAFCETRAQMREQLKEAMQQMLPDARLWVCWQKQASGAVTDLSEREVRKSGLNQGLVDYKIASIDQVWSGLCFARRAKV